MNPKVEFITFPGLAEDLKRREEEKEWKTWKRAMDGSRRKVAHTMRDLGYRISIWKKYQHRTIMQVHCPTKKDVELLKAILAKTAAKWAPKMVLKGEQWGIALSEYPSGAKGEWQTIITQGPHDLRADLRAKREV
jgi:hypothetical protein